MASLYDFPLSHVSIVARVSLCCFTSSESLSSSSPLSVPPTLRHDLKALRATFTAISTSSAVAANTLVISDSSLHRSVRSVSVPQMSPSWNFAYVGFMLVIFCPFCDLTHSLLMKRPRGCLYCTPLGALSSTSRSDILHGIVRKEAIYKGLRGIEWVGLQGELMERVWIVNNVFLIMKMREWDDKYSRSR